MRFVIQTAASPNQTLSAYTGQKKTDRHLLLRSAASLYNLFWFSFSYHSLFFPSSAFMEWPEWCALPDRYMVTHGIEQLLVSVMQDAAQRKDRVFIASVVAVYGLLDHSWIHSHRPLTMNLEGLSKRVCPFYRCHYPYPANDIHQPVLQIRLLYSEISRWKIRR